MLNKVNMAVIKLKAFIDSTVFDLKNKEKGAVDIVAIIILIAIAVAVALIFRKELAGLVTTIMKKVAEQATGAVDTIGQQT